MCVVHVCVPCACMCAMCMCVCHVHVCVPCACMCGVFILNYCIPIVAMATCPSCPGFPMLVAISTAAELPKVMDTLVKRYESLFL